MVMTVSHMTLLKRCIFLLLLPGHLSMVARGEEPAAFTPPQAYPADRYEAGWNKNPFTLKTVAPNASKGQFAADLAIGAYYGAASNPTVVLVNTKTRERILLRRDQPNASGISLKSLKLDAPRSECQVEVTLGAESAVIKYDANYLAQMSAAEPVRGAAVTPAGGRPAVMPSLPGKTPVRPAAGAQPMRVSNHGAAVPVMPMPAAAPLR